MTFDRQSWFDRSFFDRFAGFFAQARYGGRYIIATRTTAATVTTRPSSFTRNTVRSGTFTIVGAT